MNCCIYRLNRISLGLVYLWSNLWVTGHIWKRKIIVEENAIDVWFNCLFLDDVDYLVMNMTKCITYASCHDPLVLSHTSIHSGISHSTHEHTCIIQARRRTRWDPRSQRRFKSRNLRKHKSPERTTGVSGSPTKHVWERQAPEHSKSPYSLANLHDALYLFYYIASKW